MFFFCGSYAKDLIKDTIQRNASPVRLEQSSGGEKGAMGGSSSSLNSSASDESNRLQHNSRLRSSLLHSFSTNDASIGEYKYTVTVGNQSLKITGCNLDLVKVIKWPWILNLSICYYFTIYHLFINFIKKLNFFFKLYISNSICSIYFFSIHFISIYCYLCIISLIFG